MTVAVLERATLSLVDQHVHALNMARPALRRLLDYDDGGQPLSFLPPEVVQSVGDRLASLVVNWPRHVVDAVDTRMSVDGFLLNGEVVPEIGRVWDSNDLDDEHRLGHRDALVCGRAFAVVWGSDDTPDVPLVSVESAQDVSVFYEPGGRRVGSALKLWAEADGTSHAALYLPDRVERWRSDRLLSSSLVLREPVPSRWELEDVVGNPLGEVPVVPIVNRQTVKRRAGVSELADIIPLADAINKLGTDAMVTSEFHASPRRYATGIEIPRGEHRERLMAEVRQMWDEATKSKTWLAGKGVEFGQFPEAGLDGYVSLIRQFSSFVAALAALPPHYLGLSTENPASAEAIRSSESALIHRVRRRMVSFGSSWERVMTLALALQSGTAPAEVGSLKVDWHDPETPTVAEKADAAVKLVAGDRPVIDVRQAREDLGYSQAQIEAMERRERDALAETATADVRSRLALAAELQSSQGLSQAAAFAAVGLLQAAGEISGRSSPQA